MCWYLAGQIPTNGLHLVFRFHLQKSWTVKWQCIVQNTSQSHPLHAVTNSQRSLFSQRLLLPKCRINKLRNSFVPWAIKPLNSSLWERRTNRKTVGEDWAGSAPTATGHLCAIHITIYHHNTIITLQCVQYVTVCGLCTQNNVSYHHCCYYYKLLLLLLLLLLLVSLLLLYCTAYHVFS